MKSILVPVEDSEALPSMLATAMLVARRFGSYVEGLHVRPEISGVVAAGAAGLVAATPGLVESFERQDRENTARAKELFDAFMTEQSVPRAQERGAVDQPTAGWREEVAPGDDAVGSRGRVFDLILVGRPVKGKALPAMSTVEAALFDSGRPILIAPPNAPEKLGEMVVITWNGSSETARTIAMGMPFLVKATQIVVLTIEQETYPGPSGEELAAQLREHGLKVEAITANGGGRSGGEAMLQQAAELGADLMFKGAYTQSRLRQMVFGGATSHIIQAAEIPILMAH